MGHCLLFTDTQYINMFIVGQLRQAVSLMIHSQFSIVLHCSEAVYPSKPSKYAFIVCKHPRKKFVNHYQLMIITDCLVLLLIYLNEDYKDT